MPKSASSSKKPKKLTRGPVPVEDAVYARLSDAIIKKRIRPGERLKEAALATEFGVSRARIRRVLRRLAELDVVDFKLNFGAQVSRPSPEEARAVFRVRRLLEAEAVRSAMERADEATYRALEVFVRKEEKAFRRTEPGLAALAAEFHLLLAERCGNPVLARMLVQLIHRCVLIQSLYERPQQATICLVDEHVEVINLMRLGRADEAVAAMAHHIDHIEASLDYPSFQPPGTGTD